MAVRVRDDLAWLRETVVPRILAACPEAERIWLYGSRARDDHREGSDWDLMVVVPGEGLGAAGVEAAQAAASASARGQGGVQALVMSHADFHDRLNLRASFPSTIAQKGVILHEKQSMSRADTIAWAEGHRTTSRQWTTSSRRDSPRSGWCCSRPSRRSRRPRRRC